MILFINGITTAKELSLIARINILRVLFMSRSTVILPYLNDFLLSIAPPPYMEAETKLEQLPNALE